MDTAELVTTLKGAAPALGSDKVMEAYSTFRFDGGTVLASNDALAIQAPCETDGVDGCVKGSVLLQYVNAVTHAKTTFRHGGKKGDKSILLTSGRSRRNLPYLDPDTYPFEMPDVTKAHKKITGKALGTGFVGALEKVKISMQTDPAVSQLFGVKLDVDKGVGTLRSTDGKSMTRAQFELGDKRVSGEARLCPDFVAQLLRFKDRELAALYIAETFTLADYEDGWSVFGRTPQGSLVNFSSIEREEKEPECGRTELPGLFGDAIDRALTVFGKDQPPKIDLTIDDNTLTLKAEGDYGQLSDPMKLDEHEALKAVFDGKLVKRALPYASHFWVQGDPGTRVLYLKGADFTYTLMGFVVRGG